VRDNEFAALMTRFRAGDQSAAVQLVDRFGSHIRRAIRVRSTGTRLQRVLDSADVCQSVLRRLWADRDSPNLPADDPAGLVKWLMTVARNRIREEHRRQNAARRGGGRLLEVDPAGLEGIAGNGPSPSSEVADRELLQIVMAKLSPREQSIAEARGDGVGWDELAREHGIAPDALRKQYRRAIQQALESLSSS
jgi:RNA polymerase sigma factor (sigma-70 family)